MISTKDQLLSFLKETKGSWVSGETLSVRLSVSRAAIWKHIGKLREEGYVIQSSPKKGYLLLQTSEKLLPEEIREGLNTRVFGRREVRHFLETESTNRVAKALAVSGAPEGTLVVAEGQTKGRGRLGRTWFSPVGEGIYMSLILRPTLPPSEAPKMTLLAAVAAAEALLSNTPLEVSIKWPNDILVGEKKLAGILTEISTELDAIDYLVIGLGMNVYHSVFPVEFRERTTSLFLETGKRYSRHSLLRGFLEWCETYYEIFRNTGFKPILERWKALSQTLGRPIEVGTIGGRLTGTARDIDENGFLILEDDRGIRHRIISGDITVKGNRI